MSPQSDRMNQMLEIVPAIFFQYSFDRFSEKLEVKQILHNRSSKELLNPDHYVEVMRNFPDFLSPEQKAKFQQLLNNPNETPWQLDVLLQSEDQNWNWVEISGRHEKISKEKITGFGILHAAGEKVKVLRESETKLESLNTLHNLILRFSSALAQAKLEEVDAAVNETLAMLGAYAQVDRVYIFEHEAEEDVVNNTFEWCSEGISPEIDNLQGIPFDFVPRWKHHFTHREHIYIPVVADLDDERDQEKQILEPQGIISLLSIPMFYGDTFYGFIGFDAVKKQREWSEEHISLLRLAGEIISGSINRAKFETEITRARLKAEQANKAKSDFLATMSHEIRTPMNAILGFTEIVLNTSTDDKHKNYLNAVLSSSKTLLSLINDILDLSKIEAGQMDISEEAVQIRTIFADIMEVFKAKANEKNLSLLLEIDENLPATLILDDVRLRQVLFNLIGNAVKFTDKGEIRIAVSKRPSEISPKLINLQIRVEDTGIGIPKEMLPKVFDSFFQIESDNTRKYGGTGLGLSISYKLIEIMGGEIEVESEVSQGSAFTITLKSIEITDGKGAEEERKFDWKSKDVHFQNSKVLVVDDVDFNRELVKSYLAEHQLQLLEAQNGKEGVELCLRELPDLVLMDLRMPEMNGYEATRFLRDQAAANHIPIIAFTASSMKHDDKLINELFDEYLRKPIGRNELVHCLAKFLPHSVSETLAIKETETVVNPDYSPEQLHAFMQLFDKHLLAQFNELKIYFDSDLLSQFVKETEHFCRQYAISELLPVLEKLEQAREQMDFASYEQLIANIDINISNLRNKINNTDKSWSNE